MSWTNALGLCPRCEGPVEKGQMFCQRCGLLLVAPQYLQRKEPPELEASVLQPVDVPPRAESKVPAVLAMCAVLVLVAGTVMSSPHRSDNTARATPQDATATAPRPTTVPANSRAGARPPQTPTHPPTPLPLARAATRRPADTPGTPDTPASPDIPTLPSQPAATPVRSRSTAAITVEPAKLLPGIGAATTDFNAWMLKLDGTGRRAVLWSPDPDTRHDPQGAFWLAYVVYRNDSGAPRSLAATVDFALKGSDGNLYPEYSDRGRDPRRKKIASALHANPLDFTAAPGQRTTTVLVFDLPPGVEPVQLAARLLDGNSVSPDPEVAWNLRKTP